MWMLQCFLKMNKILTGWNMETKCGTDTEGKAIQRLYHLGIYPIYSHQTEMLLWMPRSACWWEPDMAVSWKAIPEPDKYRGGSSQPTIGLKAGAPCEGVVKGTEGAQGFCSPIKGTIMSTGQNPHPPPQSSQGPDHQTKNTHGGTQSAGLICGREWPFGHQCKERPLGLRVLDASV